MTRQHIHTLIHGLKGSEVRGILKLVIENDGEKRERERERERKRSICL